MKTYLVTGGAGFIGSHLVERLVGQGHQVRVLDNLSTGSMQKLESVADKIKFFEGDLQDVQLMQEAVEGVDIVFHQAALASVQRSVEHPLDTHDACVTGTVVLLDACRRANVRRVVYAASSSAYGNTKTLPKTIDHATHPRSPYAAAKLAGELYCEAFAATYGIETVRLRYFNVFGPKQDLDSPYAAVIPKFAEAILSGKQPIIHGDGTQSRDFTYVQNVVDANIAASEAEGVSGNVYNIGCGGNLRVIELLKEICQRLNKPCDPIFAEPRQGDVKHSWAEIRETEEDLGYEGKVSWQEGLQPTLDYYVKLLSKEKTCKVA
ncbi:Nucleoside-diphosphate-sugar epimerase [Planctomycetales bacterium 10988]|nr:Nucleoside-diphosphate-sugar epimerase [Planctomycetales bacterium 10988]